MVVEKWQKLIKCLPFSREISRGSIQTNKNHHYRLAINDWRVWCPGDGRWVSSIFGSPLPTILNIPSLLCQPPVRSSHPYSTPVSRALNARDLAIFSSPRVLRAHTLVMPIFRLSPRVCDPASACRLAPVLIVIVVSILRHEPYDPARNAPEFRTCLYSASAAAADAITSASALLPLLAL